MSDFQKLATNIAKGKLPGEHWNQFYVEYKRRMNRLSGTQFALNLVSLMMDENLWQEEELCRMGEDFLALVQRSLDTNFDETSLAEAFDSFRQEMKNRMECLVAYNDRYMIYQYVVNSIKYRFEDYDYKDYDDQEFTKQLLNYIISDRDQSTMRYKTMEVLKHLPIRMTKMRFFEMVKDGYSVYEGGSRDVLQSFDYMLRGAAMLQEPANMKENFPELFAYSEHFKALDVAALDAEGVYKETGTLTECIDYLNGHISSCQLLAESVNQLYAYVLTSDQSAEGEEAKVIRRILQSVCNVGVPTDGYEPDEETLGLWLASLEGIQEEELEELLQADGCLEDITSSVFGVQAGEGIQQEFRVVEKLSLLVSSSYFADLDTEADTTEVSGQEMSETYAAFKMAMEEVLTAVPKIMGRAMMSSVIGYLPMNFGNTDELQTYIYNSLAACTNLPEKMALVEQLEMIMNGDSDNWDDWMDEE